MFVEILAGALGLQNAFFLLCCSSLLRAIVGVAGGASRAALTQHQAKRNNMADVAAKDGSQETAVNLVALLVGLVLVPWINNDFRYVWGFFITATCFHIYCNYRAVKAVIMETFNDQRMHLVMEHYLQHKVILTPRQVSEKEYLFWQGPRIRLGVSLKKLLQSPLESAQRFNTYQNEAFVIKWEKPKSVYVSYFEGVTDQEILKSAVLANILIKMQTNAKLGPQFAELQGLLNRQQDELLEFKVYSYLKQSGFVEQFLGLCEARGWDLEHLYFVVGEWRILRKLA